VWCCICSGVCRRSWLYQLIHSNAAARPSAWGGEGHITSNPAQYVRRLRVHPSAQRGMDRGEFASFLYTAERTSPMHAAPAVLLGLNGLRVSEDRGANIEDLRVERGHRILRIVGKGNTPAGIPVVPRTARTVDLAIDGSWLVTMVSEQLEVFVRAAVMEPRQSWLTAHQPGDCHGVAGVGLAPWPVAGGRPG
jgi:integrase